jgi:hypothetical protein
LSSEEEEEQVPLHSKQSSPQAAEDDTALIEERKTEILEMGGDPFFLSEEKEELPLHSKESLSSPAAPTKEDTALMEERKTEILEMGGDPFFLTEEDDEIREIENDDDDNKSFPSESFLSMAKLSSEGGGGVMRKLGTINIESNGNSESDGDADDDDSMPIIDRISDLEDMGGDPFFLSEDDIDEPGDDGWEWDGMVDENAHLGFE